MRALAFVVLAALLAGCAATPGPSPCAYGHARGTDCTYATNSVVAVARFSNVTWNATAAADALRDAWPNAYASTARVVVATSGNESVRVSLRNASVLWEHEFRLPFEDRLTRAEVDARNAAAQEASSARAEDALAAFEARSGWTREAPLAWEGRWRADL